MIFKSILDRKEIGYTSTISDHHLTLGYDSTRKARDDLLFNSTAMAAYRYLPFKEQTTRVRLKSNITIAQFRVIKTLIQWPDGRMVIRVFILNINLKRRTSTPVKYTRENFTTVTLTHFLIQSVLDFLSCSNWKPNKHVILQSNSFIIFFDYIYRFSRHQEDTRTLLALVENILIFANIFNCLFGIVEFLHKTRKNEKVN